MELYLSSNKTRGPTCQPSALMIGGCVVGLLFVFFLVVLIRKWRRPKKNFFDLDLEEFSDCEVSRSAPISRQASPRLHKKRGSCPNTAELVKQNILVRSVTSEAIPNFTLPPERIQPRSPFERSATSSAFQYQQDFLESFQPELYLNTWPSDESEHELAASRHGRLWFSLIYDATVEQLSVTLIKAKELPGRNRANYTRDPFVKLFLLPDERTCRISKMKKKTLSPIFNETFVFQVPPSDLMNRSLRLSVYDVDRRKVRHSLGHVVVSLKECDLSKGDVLWRDLETMAQPSVNMGEVQFSLTHMPNFEKVKVTIHQVRNIHLSQCDMDSGAFVKVQLIHGRKVYKSKHTAVRRGVTDLEFNEGFSFTVPGRQFDSCNIIVSLMTTGQKYRLGKDEEYGRVTVGPFMFARGEELIHWQEMLSQPRHAVTKWHGFVPPNGH
ncbi:synaptotagmin-15-like [Liolophura sinensis]|uniref:synaptotagmin-15-like n=1 Tax=Liolophura sinensis TaxID=3198878 RepID=UPI003158FCC9